MTVYIRLITFTEKGSEGIKDFPKVRKEFLTKAKELGIKVQATYITLGRYDMVTILEAPDEKTLLKLEATFIGPKGRTRTETLTALSAEEFEKVVMPA